MVSGTDPGGDAWNQATAGAARIGKLRMTPMCRMPVSHRPRRAKTNEPSLSFSLT